MSRLMGELFASSPLLIWPLVSLALFLAAFTAVLVTTLRKRPSELTAVASLPLTRDEARGEP